MTRKKQRQLYDMLNNYSLEHVLHQIADYLDKGSYEMQKQARELRDFIEPID